MKQLDGLRWQPQMITHLACLQACLDYLGIGVEPAWLYGLSGHAFVINVHEALCPSGPTAWNTMPMVECACGVGADAGVIFSHRGRDDFETVREFAWDEVRAAIDEGVPVYGWDLLMPEFYLIHGYDEVGYLFRGPGAEAGAGPKPWQEIADGEIGCLELTCIRPADPVPVDMALGDALDFALVHATEPDEWIFPKYHSGPAAYDQWIAALSDGTADGLGAAYNAACWAECRERAVAFLELVPGCLGRPDLAAPLATARNHYAAVAGQLRRVADTFPFAGVTDEAYARHVEDEARVRTAVQALQLARQAEVRGLATLEEIADAL